MSHCQSFPLLCSRSVVVCCRASVEIQCDVLCDARVLVQERVTLDDAGASLLLRPGSLCDVTTKHQVSGDAV